MAVTISNLDYRCIKCELYKNNKCPGRNYSTRRCLNEDIRKENNNQK
jgi:hypothetical protein